MSSYDIEEAVSSLIKQGKSFDPMLIMNMTESSSLTEVAVYLKHMFNDKKMPGYTFQYYENGKDKLFPVYYKQVGLFEQIKNILKGKL